MIRTRRQHPTAPGNGPHTTPLLLLLGHHHCATRWMQGLLYDVCAHLGWRYCRLNGPGELSSYGSFEALTADLKPDVLACTELSRRHLQGLSAFRGIHVIRDPRDLVLLRYYRHLKKRLPEDWEGQAERKGYSESYVRYLAHCRAVQACSKEEGLALEIAYSERYFQRWRRWDYDDPRILEVKLEELAAQPDAMAWTMLTFLGILDPEDAGPFKTFCMYVNRKKAKRNGGKGPGRQRAMVRIPLKRLPARVVPKLVRPFPEPPHLPLASGEDATGGNQQESQLDWRLHFNEQHISLFKDTYDTLLVDLGYEKDTDWS